MSSHDEWETGELATGFSNDFEIWIVSRGKGPIAHYIWIELEQIYVNRNEYKILTQSLRSLTIKVLKMRVF